MQSQNFTSEDFEQFQAFLAFRKLMKTGAEKPQETFDKENQAPVDENTSRGRKPNQQDRNVSKNSKPGAAQVSKKSESEDCQSYQRREPPKPVNVLKPINQNIDADNETDLRSFADNEILNFQQERYTDSFSCSKMHQDPPECPAILRKSASPFNP